MNSTVISAMIFGIIQINVHATVSNAQATDLVMINENLVLEESFSIEWAQDANLVKTMCAADHPLWRSFDLQAVEQGSGRSQQEICKHQGRMNWHEAKAWISHLNTHAFLGYSDWRLPHTEQTDTSCSYRLESEHSQEQMSFGFGCNNSELGHLLHETLGNPANESADSYGNRLIDSGPFQNVTENTYWSGTEMSFDTSMVGVFDISSGWQDAVNKQSDLLHVWPVRSL